MFHVAEHVEFALAFTELFELCSPVDGLLLSLKLKTPETYF
jgi:hypothetical protein